MRLRIVVVLALVLGLAPGLATAESGSSRSDRAEARAELRERLAGRIATLDPHFAKAGMTSDDAFLIRGADLDKDGVEEVVDVRLHGTEDQTTGDWTETVRFDVRRGRDGALAWSKVVGDGSYVFPVFAKVGADGAMGIIVVEYVTRFVDTPAAFMLVDSTTITAIDGKGTQLWTVSDPGASVYADGGSGVETYFEGTLNATAGGGDEVLLSVAQWGYAFDPTYATETSAATVVPVIIEGASGVARPLTPLPTTSPYAWASPVPDLDKDGRDDVVVAGTVGNVTTVVAQNSSNGVALWASKDVPVAAAAYARGTGDVTGDGVADIAVSLSGATPGPLVEYGDAKVALVNGASGAVLWTRNGSRAISLGNVDGKPGAEVAIGESVYESDSVGVRFSLYNGAGNALWSVRRELSTKGLKMAFTTTSWNEIGDTGRDGVAEVGYSLRALGTSTPRWDGGIVDGRTGKVRRSPAFGMFANRLTFDGRGTDSYQVETKGKVAHATAYRGDTNGKLWRTTLPVQGTASSEDTLFAGRDKCGDLVVRVDDGATTTHIVLSGATGQPLWAVTRTGQGAGKVTHPKARSSALYQRSC